MPIPRQVKRFNRKYANRFMRHLSGIGPMAEIEHVGRRSGVVRWTPIFAFPREGVVTVALTYGRQVDWLRNVQAGGSARLRQGRRVYRLGAPAQLSASEGRERMPPPVRWMLAVMRVDDFIELPIIGAEAEIPGAGR